MIGNKEVLGFRIDWPMDLAGPDPYASGGIVSWVGNQVVWGDIGGEQEPAPVLWDLVQLLEHLARSWARITVEQTYPLGLQPDGPLKLRSEARAQWNALNLESVAPDAFLDEEELIFKFEASHNLAAGFSGLYLPHMYFMREGREMLVSTPEKQIRAPFVDVVEVLQSLGNAIVERLVGAEDAHAQWVVKRWQDRERVDAHRVVVLATGLERDDLSVVAGGRAIDEYWETRTNFRLRDNEILAAARSTRNFLDLHVIRLVVDAIKELPPAKTPELDALSLEAVRVFETFSHLNYEQGHELASWLRRKLGIADSDAFDPGAFLKEVGVEVQEYSLGHADLDALAVWGEFHGPAVLLNSDGLVASTEHGRRSTLAHELCHLLIDRGKELPFGESTLQSAKNPHERRARAFAAEVLLPRSAAYEVVNRHRRLQPAMSELMQRFAVGQQLTSWQIKNSGAHSLLSSRERTLLLRTAKWGARKLGVDKRSLRPRRPSNKQS